VDEFQLDLCICEGMKAVGGRSTRTIFCSCPISYRRISLDLKRVLLGLIVRMVVLYR